MENNNLSWLAGFWEGEGSISIFKHQRAGGTMKLKTCLTIVNTDPTLILKVLKIADSLGVTFHLFENKHDNPKWANAYALTCQRLDSSKIFLEALLPYMFGQKKQIAELTLRFINSRLKLLSENRNTPNTEEEKNIQFKVSGMNKKGVTKDSQILNDYTSNTER